MRTTLRLLLLSTALVSSSPCGGAAQEQRPVGEQREAAEKNAGKGADSADRVTQPAPTAGINDAPAERLRPERAPEADQRERESEQWWRKLTTDPNAIFAGFLTLFTAILIVIGWWQGRQLKATVDHMSKAQRAWLVPETWLSSSRSQDGNTVNVIKFQPVANSPAGALVPLRNIGKVPTIDVTVSARPTLTPRDGSAAITLPEEPGTARRVFGVNDSGDNNCLLYPRAGSESDLVRIADHSLVLTVRVEIEYRDPIGTGFTAFTMLYRPNGPAGAFVIASGDSIMR